MTNFSLSSSSFSTGGLAGVLTLVGNKSGMGLWYGCTGTRARFIRESPSSEELGVEGAAFSRLVRFTREAVAGFSLSCFSNFSTLRFGVVGEAETCDGFSFSSTGVVVELVLAGLVFSTAAGPVDGADDGAFFGGDELLAVAVLLAC